MPLGRRGENNLSARSGRVPTAEAPVVSVLDSGRIGSKATKPLMSGMGGKQTLEAPPCKLPLGGSADDQFRVRLLAAGDPARARAGGGVRRAGASCERAPSSAGRLGDRAARYLDNNAHGAVLA